jgi:hypothetical protein
MFEQLAADRDNDLRWWLLCVCCCGIIVAAGACCSWLHAISTCCRVVRCGLALCAVLHGHSGLHRPLHKHWDQLRHPRHRIALLLVGLQGCRDALQLLQVQRGLAWRHPACIHAGLPAGGAVVAAGVLRRAACVLARGQRSCLCVTQPSH